MRNVRVPPRSTSWNLENFHKYSTRMAVGRARGGFRAFFRRICSYLEQWLSCPPLREGGGVIFLIISEASGVYSHLTRLPVNTLIYWTHHSLLVPSPFLLVNVRSSLRRLQFIFAFSAALAGEKSDFIYPRKTKKTGRSKPEVLFNFMKLSRDENASEFSAGRAPRVVTMCCSACITSFWVFGAGKMGCNFPLEFESLNFSAFERFYFRTPINNRAFARRMSEWFYHFEPIK